VEVLWSRWFLAYAPCDLITILIAWRLTLYFYPPEKAVLPGGAAVLQDAVKALGPWTPHEQRAALLMGAAIALWMSDFIHHIAAPMIVGYSYGCLSARDMLRIGACLTVAESLIVLVLVPVYWPLIGI